MSATHRFPASFLWGAATASHQVEGDNRGNDWWALEESGGLPHRSGRACDHFGRYADDFSLAASFGHNAHRLSLEWSRIEPRPGEFDPVAIQHYVDVVAALRARGLEPVVTLHHFTNPAWFAARGGWERRDSVQLFLRYVRCVVARLAGEVRFWLTINEPTVYVMRGYVAGNWPPLRPRSWLRGARVLRNLCRAHSAAYPVIHAHRSDAMVSFAHSAPYVVPRDANRGLDRLAARVRDFLLNELCFRWLGRPAKEVLDFIGLNYYVRQVIAWQPRGIGLLFGREHKENDAASERRFSTLGWEMHPDGLRAVLVRYARYGLPLMITENGFATADEPLREQFIEAHVRSVALAMREGADVRGYLYWTLFDNYEWTEGYGAQFGLAAVDAATLNRIPRPAAATFAKICRSGEIELESSAAAHAAASKG